MNHLQLQSFVFYRVLGRKGPGQIVLQDELPGKRTFCFSETLLWSWFMWCLRSETGQVLLGVFCLKRKEAELDQEGPVRFFHWLAWWPQLEHAAFQVRRILFSTRGNLYWIPKALQGLTLFQPMRDPWFAYQRALQEAKPPWRMPDFGEISHQVTTFLHSSVSPAATDRLPKPTALPLETLSWSPKAAQAPHSLWGHVSLSSQPPRLWWKRPMSSVSAFQAV